MLICRDYVKLKNITFNVNFEYEIIEIMENNSGGVLLGGRAPANSLKIKNVTSPDTCEAPIKIIRSHFQFNYCTTCHSVQGSTI